MKFVRFILPPPHWRFPVILVLGVFFGLAGFAFYISRAYSYLSDNPKTEMPYIMPKLAVFAFRRMSEVTSFSGIL